MAKCILVVDDDPAQRRILEETIKRFGYATRTVDSGETALAALDGAEPGTFALILLDLVMPQMDGMTVLDRLKSRGNHPPVIVQTAHGSIDTAILAMRAGAVDFVVKPVSPERLEVSIANAIKIETLAGEIGRIRRQTAGEFTFHDLITASPAMDRVIALGRRAAQSTIPVLIEGESGVGKEVVARAIQGESERSGKPFVVVNCGAIPENLVESILFGHEKGAFTGATDKRKGKFVEADGGTLFLDEIGELPLDAQVKLLRALQEGEVDPVGGKRPITVDIRLISATNRDMLELVREGKFREDLFYRLNVFPVWIPPLRDRREDIPGLAQHFVARIAAEEGKRIDGIEADALELLAAYQWPGNVRQLENAIFRAIVLADTPRLGISEFPQIAAQVTGTKPVMPAAPAPVVYDTQCDGPVMIGSDMVSPATIPMDASRGAIGIPAMTEFGEMRSLEQVEADMIRLAIGRYRGRMTEVAKRLGIGRSTLYRKMREIGLQPPA